MKDDAWQRPWTARAKASRGLPRRPRAAVDAATPIDRQKLPTSSEDVRSPVGSTLRNKSTLQLEARQPSDHWTGLDGRVGTRACKDRSIGTNRWVWSFRVVRAGFRAPDPIQ